MTAQTTTPAQVTAQVRGRLGHLTLNRPERINALNQSMVRAVATALAGWANDPEVGVVLIDGAGPRGLCAGGDIREIYDGLQGGPVTPGAFWTEEYAMNAMIAVFPKPVVTVMDGIVFGGGVGISAHASVRLVTERSQVAMPETAIGLAPDVGALYLLSRSPGEFGTHAALTGARLDGAGAIHAGLADHLVDSAELPAITEELESAIVPQFPPPPAGAHPGWIDNCYAATDVEGIGQALARHADPAAQAAAAVLGAMSPTALKVTLEAIRRARTMTLGEVLDQDFRVGSRFLRHHDLAEGIRAQIIDKDRNPRWAPAALDQVSREAVLAFFEPLA